MPVTAPWLRPKRRLGPGRLPGLRVEPSNHRAASPHSCPAPALAAPALPPAGPGWPGNLLTEEKRAAAPGAKGLAPAGVLLEMFRSALKLPACISLDV